MSLRSGQTASCGCLRNERASKSNFFDIAGKTFGILTAISVAGKYKNSYVWLCQCECGNTKEIIVSALTSGNTRSCGCLRNRPCRLYGDQAIVQNDPHNSRRITIIDERYGRMVVIREVEQKGYERFFLCRCDCGNEKVVRMHSLRTGATKSCGCLKKGITTEPNQNVATDGLSMRHTRSCRCHKKKGGEGHSTGVKGVSKVKKHGRYIAYITINYKRKHLGSFTTLEESCGSADGS